jgi:hypothetical protein
MEAASTAIVPSFYRLPPTIQVPQAAILGSVKLQDSAPLPARQIA